MVQTGNRTARYALVVLTCINLFNYLDRWIVAALAESMKHSELALSDTQLGSLMTGFLIVYTFAIGALAFWTTTFLERVRGIPKAQATVQFGAIVVVTGFVGTYAGGWLGDRWLRTSSQAYLWMSGIATLVAAPLTLAALAASQPSVYWPAIVAAELCLFASTGPINSTIVNIVSPHMRATAMATCIFAIHILGDVPSPSLVGAISDASSLARAVLIIPVAVLLGGVIWTF